MIRRSSSSLDPIYVDVTLARWERFSGQVAVRADG
jgi:hypothetical protein